MKYQVSVKIADSEEKPIIVCGSEAVAIEKAREVDAMSTPWEEVVIRKVTKNGTERVPYKVFVISTATGDILDEIKGNALLVAIDMAVGFIADYEADDKVAGTYKDGAYDIVDEFGATYTEGV